ncbi:Ion channel, partial [Oesophagostomum dentatum]
LKAVEYIQNVKIHAVSGYGSIYPTTEIGKICCVAYCVVGVPLLFLVLSNNGQFVVDAYWILRKSAGGKVTGSKSLPLWLSALLICMHSLVGGLIFGTWLGQMRFFEGIYCSFISISTIGYGDFTPVPDTWTHTIAIMTFLSAGVVILSTLFDTFGYYLNYLHYIGRRFTGTKDVEIWFGGRMLTVQELITIVADEFGVSPRKLRTVMRDLDDILHAACDDTVKNRSETLYKTGEVIRNEVSAFLLRTRLT